MKLALMILRRSLTPIVGTVLFKCTKIDEPLLIPPLSMASRSRLPVDKEDCVYRTGERMFGLAEAWVYSFVFASRLHWRLSSEKRARSDLTLRPRSLFTTIVL